MHLVRGVKMVWSERFGVLDSRYVLSFWRNVRRVEAGRAAKAFHED